MSSQSLCALLLLLLAAFLSLPDASSAGWFGDDSVEDQKAALVQKLYKQSEGFVQTAQYTQALQDVTQALNLESKSIKGLMLRARVHILTGDCELAQQDLHAILEQQPHEEATTELLKVTRCTQLITKGWNLLDSKQWEQAKHTLTQALDLAPGANRLVFLRISCHAELKDWQAVLVDSDKFLQAEQVNPQTNYRLEALIARGGAFYHLGELRNALMSVWRKLRRCACFW